MPSSRTTSTDVPLLQTPPSHLASSSGTFLAINPAIHVAVAGASAAAVAATSARTVARMSGVGVGADVGV